MIKITRYNYTNQEVTIVYDNTRAYVYHVPEYWYRRMSRWNGAQLARFLRRLKGEKIQLR